MRIFLNRDQAEYELPGAQTPGPSLPSYWKKKKMKGRTLHNVQCRKWAGTISCILVFQMLDLGMARTKNERELEVFRPFSSAATLPVADLIHTSEPEPDIRCSVNHVTHYFELSEVLFEPDERRGGTIAKSLHQSESASKRGKSGYVSLSIRC